MPFQHILIASVPQLEDAVADILAGHVAQLAIDTETTEVVDGYFTTFGTDLRMAGFSLSWGTEHDLYVPLRHVPYDWRRTPEQLERDTKNDGPVWLHQLLEVERVAREGGWQAGADPNVDLEGALAVLRAVMSVPGMTLYAHNWSFDSKVLERDGVPLAWERMEDTQALSVLTDPRPLDKWDEDAGEFLHGGHALKHLGETWLGVPRDAQQKLEQAKAALGKGGALLNNYAMLPLRSALAPYAAMDTRLTLSLAEHIAGREAAKDERVAHLNAIHRAERMYLHRMEKLGLPVDTELAAEREAELKLSVTATDTRLKGLAGGALVPVASPTKLAPFLYDELSIPRYRGQDDTRDATLKQVRAQLVADGAVRCGPISADDAVRLLDGIVEYRHLTKDLSAFFAPMAKGQGVVHPIMRPLGARTTRMTCEKPNAHQMRKPRKEEDPTQSVRHLVKPPDGYGLLLADYSAQEMRVSAHYTAAIPEAFAYRFTWRCTLQRRGDCKGRGKHGPNEVHVGYRETLSTRPKLFLLDGFMREGTSFDPHQRMVEMCAHKGLDLNRNQCKTANFAILYGCGGPKLAGILGCSVSTAYQLIRMFWDEVYPELGRVKQFIDERLRRVGPPTKFSHQEYITTLHGGRIYLSDGYKGLNYVVQRSCREILAQAIVSVGDYLESIGASDVYQMRLPVHDELMLMVPTDQLDQEVVRNICKRMVLAGSASRVPMVVEPNWATRSWAFKEPLGDGWGYNGVTDEE